MLLCGALIHVIADEVKVTMKNGTVFTAELKEFVPTDHITVVVGGIESVVPISEVVSIDKANVVQPPTPMSISNSHSVYGMYEITDTKQYPDSFILNVGSQQLTMVLIRGGWFNMGYDGHNSLFWDTEPIHKVTLSSYYISKQLHKVKYKKNADDLLSNLREKTYGDIVANMIKEMLIFKSSKKNEAEIYLKQMKNLLKIIEENQN